MTKGIELNTLFQSVAERLSEQQETLNEADGYNHDHGDHMVQIFRLIQSATAQKADQPVADQLEYASSVVKSEADSGSAKLYAQGLSKAAENFSRSDLNENNIGDLVKSLLMTEDPQDPQESQNTAENKNLFGSLLSGVMGNGDKSEGSDQKFGIDEIFHAGMAFFDSKQEGEGNADAIIAALLAASPMSGSAHRSQSGSLVASTILDFAKSFKQ